MKTFFLTLLIFAVGLTVIWKDVKTDSNTKHVCTFLSKNICVIETDDAKIEKVDISHVDVAEFKAGQEIVYKEETPKQIAAGQTVGLILFCFIFFTTVRIFSSGNGGRIDFSSAFNVFD